MRREFMEALVQVAKADDRVILLTCDVGFGILDSFKREFPERFFNLGISEESAISAALGFYTEGKIPFVYSIGPFLLFKPFEHIRLDLCYHNAHVVLVGSGSGYAYDFMGVTHWTIEDVGILRCLPNMTIFAPGDPFEAKWAVKMAHQHAGPSYIRLGRFDEKTVHSAELQVGLGKAVVVGRQESERENVVIFSAGTALNLAMEVVRRLSGDGLEAVLVSMPTMKPFDRDAVLEHMQRATALFTIEDHSVIGGLGDAVGRIVAEHSQGSHVVFRGFGLPDAYPKFGGSVGYLREAHGLTVERLTREIEDVLCRALGGASL